MDLEKDILENIEMLGHWGKTEDNGTNILVFDQNWLKTRESLLEKLSELGFCTASDTYGNITGTIEGSKYPQEIIASGSHIDTVVNGGKLDGHFGIAAAYLAMNKLLKEHGKPLRTLKTLAFAEEEGSRFPSSFWGSKSYTGTLDYESMKDLKDKDGITFAEALKNSGFSYTPNIEPEKLKAFVEIHIEQGGRLEKENKTIGVVECITGFKRFDITFKGKANHAGTTPMDLRFDPVCAFSSVVNAMTEKVKKEGSPAVITFGRVQVSPNVTNVIAAEVRFSIDLRHTVQEVLDRLGKEVLSFVIETAEKAGIEHHIAQTADEAPVYMEKNLGSLVEKVCVDKSLPYMRMHSGAGHDSQVLACHYPTCMIFVPSVAGISHSPLEHTPPADLVAGVEVLAGVLYELAYKE